MWSSVVRVARVVRMVRVFRVVRRARVVQVVQVIHIWFTNPREKLRCHVCDEHKDIRTSETRALFC
jgi:hypothetical protein